MLCSRYIFALSIKVGNTVLIDFPLNFQQEDSGLTLTVSIHHNNEPDPEILWHLEDAQVQEPKWYEGRLEVRPRDGDASTFIVSSHFKHIWIIFFSINRACKIPIFF